MTVEVSLEDLAVRAQHGDRASFDALVSRVRAPLVAFLVRRVAVPQDADDVAQETLARAYKHLASYDPNRKFSTWLFAIGKNTAINFRVAQQRRERLETDEATELATTAEPAPSPETADDHIWQVAKRVLTDQAYRALWLRYGQDLGVREVARQIGKSVVGTKVLLFRARGKLLKETVS